MHARDIRHPDPELQQKLQQLFSLRRGGGMSSGIRPVYLDLLRRLGNPQDNLPPVIHVAGTNGKGSTIAFLRAMAEEAGMRVHVYTSPHLVRFNERIVVAGETITDDALSGLIQEALALNGDAEISFFEITTAIALAAFARQPADLVLLETGMGGLYDCTNVVARPALTVITAVGYDHQEYLGADIGQIARQKAGIIKRGVPCVTGYQPHSRALEVITEEASKRGNAPLYAAGGAWSIGSDESGLGFSFANEAYRFNAPGLQGLHQIQNAGLACAAMKVLDGRFHISQAQMNRGLTRAHWPARLQNVTAAATAHLGAADSPAGEIWLDGAHNVDGAQALATTLSRWQDQDGKRLSLLIGMMGHKDAREFLTPLSALAADFYALGIPGEPGAHTPESLSALSARPMNLASDWRSAVQAARQKNPGGRIVIAGSLYLAGHVLETLGLAPG